MYLMANSQIPLLHQHIKTLRQLQQYQSTTKPNWMLKLITTNSKFLITIDFIDIETNHRHNGER